MKKIHYLCLGLALVLAACGKDDSNPPDDPTTNPPTIASFFPTEGTPGTTVEITGTNFSATASENTVKFNGTSASVSSATATKLTVSVPNGATSGKISVTVDGQTAQSSTDFTVLDPPTISISGFTPDQENVGAEVVIEGENFSTIEGGNTVEFNGAAAQVKAATATQLTVIVPEGATTGTITVTVGQQTVESTTEFTVGPWRKLADFPGEARRGAVIATLEDGNGNPIIMAGFGYGLNSGQLDDFWTYNPQSNDWTGDPNSYLKRNGAFSFVIDNIWYLGGGYDGIELNDFYKFDPEWTAIANAPYLGTNSPSFVFGNTGFIYGRTSDLSAFYAYDTDQNMWFAKNPFEVNPRVSPCGFAINGKGYIATGSNDGTYFNDLHQYDFNLNSWTEKQSLDSGLERYGAIGFAINGKGYLSTGANFSNNTRFNDMWEYNPDSDAWTSKSPYPSSARYGASVTTIEGKAYIIFGEGDGTDDNDFWEYTPALDN